MPSEKSPGSLFMKVCYQLDFNKIPQESILYIFLSYDGKTKKISSSSQL